jgi:hypothetical protein
MNNRRPADGSISDDEQIGLAIVMAADEEDHREPVAVASTIGEARELAESDMRRRTNRLENGDDPGLCPYEYCVYAEDRRTGEGYKIVASFQVTELNFF